MDVGPHPVTGVCEILASRSALAHFPLVALLRHGQLSGESPDSRRNRTSSVTASENASRHVHVRARRSWPSPEGRRRAAQAVPHSDTTVRLAALPSHFTTSTNRQTAIRSRVAATASRSTPLRSRITTIDSHLTTMRSRITTMIEARNSLFLVLRTLQTTRNSPITRGGDSPTSDCYCREIWAAEPGIRAESAKFPVNLLRTGKSKTETGLRRTASTATFKPLISHSFLYLPAI